MAKSANNKTLEKVNPPQTLDRSGFFRRLSFKLAEEQKVFRDAIYNPQNKIIFCNAKSGSGKTTIAIATACAMIEYQLYDKLIYTFAPIGYENVGLLPGTLEDKTEPFYEPLSEALIECGYFPNKVINQLCDNAKSDEAFVDCKPHTFLRGTNFDNAIIIIDEAQNFYLDELKKVLTRVKDNCKVVVIGHDQQCDIFHHKERSGFIPYLNWFKNEPYCQVCELDHNYRGIVSAKADELPNLIDVQQVVLTPNTETCGGNI